MVDNAWAFAARNNVLRTSEIHGEEEANLVLQESFSKKDEESLTTQQEMHFTVEVPCPIKKPFF